MFAGCTDHSAVPHSIFIARALLANPVAERHQSGVLQSQEAALVVRRCLVPHDAVVASHGAGQARRSHRGDDAPVSELEPALQPDLP